MKTINKYFENLFDVDDDTPVLTGEKVGENGIIKKVTDKGIIIEEDIRPPLKIRDEHLNKIISIGKAMGKPLIFNCYTDIEISKDVDFKGIEIQTEWEIRFSSSKGLTISNFTINSGAVKIDCPQCYTFVNCNINCNTFYNLETTCMPYVISKKINVKKFIDYKRNTRDGFIKEIYNKYKHNEINELDINKLFNLKNVNVPYMELEGIIGLIIGDEERKLMFFHKSNPEFNKNKNKEYYYLDKSKQWLIHCYNYSLLKGLYKDDEIF